MKILKFLPAVLCMLCAAGGAHAQAGRFQFVHGDVRVTQANGSTLLATKGSIVEEGDTIATSPSGQAQLTMKDGGIISMRPDSTLRIEVYRYSEKAAASSQGFFALLKGGFRSITGAIGRANHNNYRVNTPTATIGIRGTDHEPLFIPVPAPGETPVGPPGTYDKVNTGGTYLQTAAGRVDLGANQVGFVPALGNTSPVRLQNVPDFLKATPSIQASNKGAPAKETAATESAPTKESATTTASSDSGPTIPAPVVELARRVVPGTFDPANPSAGGGVLAPAGTVVAGGFLTSGTFNSGAAVVGSSNNLNATLDTTRAPVTLFGTDFAYTRAGALILQSDSTTIGTDTVRWGIYQGGTYTNHGNTSNDTRFYWMTANGASTTASLLTAMPTSGSTLTFSTVAGYTKPMNENGAVGGSVTSLNIVLKNITGTPSLQTYTLGVTDAQGRTWTGNIIGTPALATLNQGSANLTTSCIGACASTGTGNVQGSAIGNPAPTGFVSSYRLNAGTATVAGSVASKN